MTRRSVIPERDLERLGNLVSYLIIQREKKRPVATLHDTIKDVRRIIQNMITRYYLPLDKEDESSFIGEMIDFLCDLKEELRAENFDEDFCDYFIGKIISSFERADKIKQWTQKGPAQEELISSLPILDRFDFKLKPFIKLLDQRE